jgi:hypothetical protein
VTGLFSFSTISGGCCNSVTGGFSTVSGGCNNTVSGNRSIVSAGCNNTASGNYSGIVGGSDNTATCNYSGIFGCNITSVAACTFHVNCLALMSVPTSSSGLCAGMVWSDSCVLKIV